MASSHECPPQIGPLLAKVCELKHRRMHQLLDPLGLYSGQTAVLRALWGQDGETQCHLAEQLDRNPATITKMVQRMEKAGFVVRKPDPGDERLSRVFLTAQGRQVQSAVESAWQDLEDQAFSGLGAQERAALAAALSQIARNLEEETP